MHRRTFWESTMSDENCNVPCEHQADAPLLLANRDQFLDNCSLSLSLESARCNFNLSPRGGRSSPDMSALRTGAHVTQPNNALSQINLENTFFTTAHSMYLFDDTCSVTSNQESDEGMNSAMVSPNSEMSSCGTSCRGSVDLSFSSGEMMVRSNSLLLEEQAVPLVLSPEEPRSEPRALLAHVSENKGAASHAFLGLTFEFGAKVELPGEDDVAKVKPSLALSAEKANVGATFLCENSAADGTDEAQFIYSDSEKLNESGAVEIPDQSIFDSPVYALQDEDRHAFSQIPMSNNLTSCRTASEGSSSAVASADVVRVRSCRTSCRGSVDLSFSDGEMVVRRNSFVLEEQDVPFVVSSLEESPVPQVSSHTESKLFLTPVCEQKDAGEHPHLGVTFVLGDSIELPKEDVSVCASSLALPGERASLRNTFLCENSLADLANEAQFIVSGAEGLSETYACETPVQAITFDTPLCTVQGDDICTSTPLQVLGSDKPSLPSFTVSPCTENTASPALRPVLRRRTPATPKPRETSGSKVTRTSPSDQSGLKCKGAAALCSALLDRPSHMNSLHDGHTAGSFKPCPARNIKGTASPLCKAVPQRRQDLGANKNQNNVQISPVSDEMAPPVRHSPASPRTEQTTSSQTRADPKAHAANATFCYPEKSPQKSVKTVVKPTPKNDLTNKTKSKLGSPVVHETSASKPSNSSPCSSSERANTVSRFLKTVQPQKPPASFTLSKSMSQTKTASSPRRAGGTLEATATNCRKAKKIGLVVDPNTAMASCCADTNSRVCGQPSPKQTGKASTSRAPAASPLTTTALHKQRPGASGREVCRTTAAVSTPLSVHKPTVSRKASAVTSLAAAPAARTRPAPLHLQTTPRSSLMGPPLTPVPRPLQRQGSCGSTGNQRESTAHGGISDRARAAQASRVVGRCPTPFKVPILKAKLATTPAKTSSPVLIASGKSTPTTRGLPNSSPKRTPTAAKLTKLSAPVDKSKPNAQQQQQQQQDERSRSRPQQGTGRTQDVGPAGVIEGRLQHLQTRLIQNNHRFEAFTVVLQQTLAQRDEAVRQSRGLSQELLELRGELMHTVNRSECLAQEKEALKASLQEALEQVQAQHQRDLLELEQRLREQHHNETSAAQQQLREEAERSRATLQLQLQELRAAHETMKQDLEMSHSQQLQSEGQTHQLCLQELRDAHLQELESLNRTLNDAETVLNEKIRTLTQENAALMERLTDEENRNKDTSQKDSHTVYLERELESLNVVLDMKTKQLHQQEKKLMEVDKLVETNVKLGESLRKVQQENEDLKARMERHAALSRQLSSEQTLLQESLQKESKVNKRLSMENEELLWKLHNGDLSSPRKSNPNPPSPHFSLQSPRAPSLISSPPVSPR